MTPAEANTVVATLAAAYPRHFESRETRLLYATQIVTADHETAAGAAVRLIRTSAWPPSIAEVLGAIEHEAAIRLRAKPGFRGEISAGEPGQDPRLAERTRAAIQRLTSRIGRPMPQARADSVGELDLSPEEVDEIRRRIDRARGELDRIRAAEGQL